jgi:IS1 family transposase
MMKCPHCKDEQQQVKIGHNPSGSQRYLCKVCRRKYTPEPKEHGYSQAVRHVALKLYVDGMNLRRIGRTLGVDHQTVANWVTAHANQLPDSPPVPGQWIGRIVYLHREQKNEAYIVTNVDRVTRCIVGWDVVFERDYLTMQAMLDRSPQAKQYYSDAFAVYETLVYFPGHWRAFADKSQTFSVEADNAELRHYLAR